MDVFSQFPLNLLLLLVMSTGIKGRITKFPMDSVVLKGKTNVFTCCSDIQKTIFWKHKPVGSSSTNDINDLVGLVDDYLTFSRFNVTPGNSVGCYILIIKYVTSRDEGMYSCTDDEGVGQWKGWELIILESFVCQETNRKVEYMGVSDFDLPQDVISVVCIAKYFGNVPPKPTCEWSSGKRLVEYYRRLTETNSTVTLSIQMPARKEFNGDQLLCYVNINGDSSDKHTEFAWKSPHLIINYAAIHQKGVSQCSDDQLSFECQPLCDYKMVRHSNGSKYCEISYPGKTPQKIFIPLQDNDMPGTTDMSSPAQSSDEGHDNSLSVKVALAAVTGGMIGIVVGFLICWFLKCKRHPQPNGEAMELRDRRLLNTVGSENRYNNLEILTLLNEGDTKKIHPMSTD